MVFFWISIYRVVVQRSFKTLEDLPPLATYLLTYLLTYSMEQSPS